MNIGELQASDYFDRVFTYRNSETDILAVNSIIGLHSLGFILGDKTNLHFSEYNSAFQITLMFIRAWKLVFHNHGHSYYFAVRAT